MPVIRRVVKPPTQRELDDRKYNEAVNRIKGLEYNSDAYKRNASTIETLGRQYQWGWARHLTPPPAASTTPKPPVTPSPTGTGGTARSGVVGSPTIIAGSQPQPSGAQVIPIASKPPTTTPTPPATGAVAPPPPAPPAPPASPWMSLSRDLAKIKYQEANNRIKSGRFKPGDSEYEESMRILSELGGRWGWNHQDTTGGWTPAPPTVTPPTAGTPGRPSPSGVATGGPSTAPSGTPPAPGTPPPAPPRRPVPTPAQPPPAQPPVTPPVAPPAPAAPNPPVPAPQPPAPTPPAPTPPAPAAPTPAAPPPPAPPRTTPSPVAPTPALQAPPAQGIDSSPMTRMLLNMLSGNGSTASAYEPKNFEGSPMYQFQKQEGMKDLEKLMAARGLTGSGAEIQANSDFLAQLGATEADKQRQYAQADAERRMAGLQNLANYDLNNRRFGWDQTTGVQDRAFDRERWQSDRDFNERRFAYDTYSSDLDRAFKEKAWTADRNFDERRFDWDRTSGDLDRALNQQRWLTDNNFNERRFNWDQNNTNINRLIELQQLEKNRQDSADGRRQNLLLGILGLQANNPIAEMGFKGTGEASQYSKVLSDALAAFTANDYNRRISSGGGGGSLPPPPPSSGSDIDIAKMLLNYGNSADNQGLLATILNQFAR